MNAKWGFILVPVMVGCAGAANEDVSASSDAITNTGAREMPACYRREGAATLVGVGVRGNDTGVICDVRGLVVRKDGTGSVSSSRARTAGGYGSLPPSGYDGASGYGDADAIKECPKPGTRFLICTDE